MWCFCFQGEHQAFSTAEIATKTFNGDSHILTCGFSETGKSFVIIEESHTVSMYARAEAIKSMENGQAGAL